MNKMSHHVIEYDERCKYCDGTGVYTGMAERDGAGVVCHTCRGTGCHHCKIEYDDFEVRLEREDVEHVYEVNPGIVIGKGDGEYSLSDFGGISYNEWLEKGVFPEKSENRRFTCPTWWYQSADYKKKPKWKECWKSLGSSFSKCPYFKNKEKCWEKWDRENK
jgi:hypothetical protein